MCEALPAMSVPCAVTAGNGSPAKCALGVRPAAATPRGFAGGGGGEGAGGGGGAVRDGGVRDARVAVVEPRGATGDDGSLKERTCPAGDGSCRIAQRVGIARMGHVGPCPVDLVPWSAVPCSTDPWGAVCGGAPVEHCLL